MIVYWMNQLNAWHADRLSILELERLLRFHILIIVFLVSLSLQLKKKGRKGEKVKTC